MPTREQVISSLHKFRGYQLTIQEVMEVVDDYAKQPEPVKPEDVEVARNCFYCLYQLNPCDKEPCLTCIDLLIKGFPNFKPKP